MLLNEVMTLLSKRFYSTLLSVIVLVNLLLSMPLLVGDKSQYLSIIIGSNTLEAEKFFVVDPDVATNWLRSNPLGVYQFWVSPSFWKVNKADSGAFDLLISKDTNTVIDANSSLQIERTAGSYKIIFLYHDFSPPVNITPYDFIAFGIYGNNTNALIKFWLCSNYQNRSFYEWQDNFVGWKELYFELEKPTFTENRGANLSAIDMMGFDGFIDNYLGSGILVHGQPPVLVFIDTSSWNRVLLYALINILTTVILLGLLWKRKWVSKVKEHID